MQKSKIFSIFLALALIVATCSNVLMYISVKDMTEKEKTVNVISAGADLKEEPSKEEETTVNAPSSEKKDENTIDVVSKDTIKSYFGDKGEGVLKMLRDIYTDDIVYYDGKYKFEPINKELALSTIDLKGFEKDKYGHYIYKENGKVVGHKGIDVSKYQGDIDWKKVKEDGIEFAIIRIGYRGYGSGQLVMDENAIANLKGASDAGIDIGVYFFTQAIDEEEAKEEADYIIKAIKKYNVTYPIVIDTEPISGDEARSDALSAKERTEVVAAFCERVKEKNYKPMIYANIKWFITALDMTKLEDYDKWFAYYDDELYFPYKIAMWQYSGTGRVSGITGDVDLNVYFGE